MKNNKILNNYKIINTTKSWIESFVIKHQLCPFAKKGFQNNDIFYYYSAATSNEDILNDFWKIIQKLNSNQQISNAFLILNPSISFDDLLTISSILDIFLEEQDEENYQLVDFHPDLVFADTPIDDASNYINRSPYPMIHILRTIEVENAIENSSIDIEKVPYLNIQKMHTLGIPYLKSNITKT